MDPKNKLYIAQYEFNATEDHHLSINVNDKIYVFEEQNGWYRGQNIETNCYGWFPGNYGTLEETEIKMNDPDDAGEKGLKLRLSLRASQEIRRLQKQLITIFPNAPELQESR